MRVFFHLFGLLLSFMLGALACGRAGGHETAGLGVEEENTLNRLLQSADSLANSSAQLAASDSILQAASALLRKSGRTKSLYRAHRRRILNLVAEDNTREAQLLGDSLIRQYGVPDDSISGYYNGLMGWLYWETGDYRAVIPRLERAAALFEKYGLESKLNGIYNNLGRSYGQLGDHEKAIENYNAALRLNERQGDSVEMANNHLNLALAYMQLGDLNSAERHNLAGKNLQPEDDGSFYLQQAEIDLACGQIPLALSRVKQLQRLHPELLDPENSENAYSNQFAVGEILLAAGQAKAAVPFLEAWRTHHTPSVARSDWELTKNQVLLGNACLKLGDPRAALGHFQAAIKATTPVFTLKDEKENPPPDSFPPEVWAMEALYGKTTALDQISLAQFQSGAKQEAEATLHAAIATAKCAVTLIQKLKSNFVEDGSRLWLGEYAFQNFYEKPLALALRLHAWTGDPAALEHAFFFAATSKAGVLRTALAERQELIRAGISTDTIRMLRALRLSAASLQNRLSLAPSDSLRVALFQVKRRLDELRSRLHLPTEKPAAPYNISVSATQAALPEGVMMISFFLGERNLYVFSVSKKRFEVEIKPVPADFSENTESFIRSVSDWKYISGFPQQAEQSYLQMASRLYGFLLESTLKLHPNTTRLFVVPDKNLARIPFAALLTRPYAGGWKDRDLPVLIKEMAVSYRFSPEMPVGGESVSSPRYGFGGFGTDYRDGLTFSDLKKSRDPLGQNFLLALRGGPDTLDFADDEVDSIARLTGGQKWLNRQATKANFLANAPDCQILHLSLHTIKTDLHDPTGLAILFSKINEADANLLTSNELYALDLNTELAVVSSCQSGAGAFRQGEGTLSLGRAMALAGCHATVVNLWKADDQSSRDVMIAFYKNLKSGQPKDVALQAAFLEYLQQTISERAGPQYWANFSAVGEMEPVRFTVENHDPWLLWLGGLFALLLVLGFVYLKKKTGP